MLHIRLKNQGVYGVMTYYLLFLIFLCVYVLGTFTNSG